VNIFSLSYKKDSLLHWLYVLYDLVVTLSAALLSAGVRQVALTPSSDSSNVRNIPVNSDMYLAKAEHNVPAEEQFFYRSVMSLSSSSRCLQFPSVSITVSIVVLYV